MNGGGVDEEGIAGTVESFSDPEALASEAVVSLQESEGYGRAQAEVLARRLRQVGRGRVRLEEFRMLDRLFSSGSLPALEAMLRFASERQRAIAGNIANVETAGYRTRDLSESGFRQELSRLFQGDGLGTGALRAGPAADAGTLKPGGNNVDLEIEMAKMVRNNALHSTAAALLAHQYSLLREAISGHVIS